jgi:hypothetical protein
MRVNFIEASVVYAPLSFNQLAHVLAALDVGIAHEDNVLGTSSYPTILPKKIRNHHTSS